MDTVTKRQLAAQATGEKLADTKRNARLLQLHEQGHSYADLARRFGISRARVHQIVSRERAKR